MGTENTATQTANDRLKLQLDCERPTLSTAAGTDAGLAICQGGKTIWLSSGVSADRVREDIESSTVANLSIWKAEGDRLFAFFVPQFVSGGLRFETVVKSTAVRMSDACKALDHGTYLLAGNANFFNLPEDFTYAEYASPAHPDRVTVTGQVLQNGSVVKGNSNAERAYIHFDSGSFQTGFGDPPTGGTAHGLGGLVPVIISGSQFVPDPTAKKVPDSQYRVQNKPKVGKNVFAYHSGWDMAAVLWQADSQASNIPNPFASGFHSMDMIRDFLAGLGFEHAVSMDGSSSAWVYVYPTRTLHWATLEFKLKDNAMPVAWAVRRS